MYNEARNGNGKAVEQIFPDGSKKNISNRRVKEWVPETHPNAPPGTLRQKQFKNALPGSKGKKRAPTQSERNYVDSL